MIPGEYLLDGPPIELNAGRPTCTVEVKNTGDRPIQVGAHFHFFEVNRALVFDREAAYGMRLDLPAGTAVRFEPGEAKRSNSSPWAASAASTAATRWSWVQLDDSRRRQESLKRMRAAKFGDAAEQTKPPKQKPRPKQRETTSRQSVGLAVWSVPHEPKTEPSGLRRALRTDRRRPCSPGRHRPPHRDREGLRRLWRGGRLRRGKVDPRRPGRSPRIGTRSPRRISTSSSPTR